MLLAVSVPGAKDAQRFDHLAACVATCGGSRFTSAPTFGVGRGVDVGVGVGMRRRRHGARSARWASDGVVESHRGALPSVLVAVTANARTLPWGARPVALCCKTGHTRPALRLDW